MYPQILGIGTANPPIRLTQEQTFYAAGYKGQRIRTIFLNSDIRYRHFYFGSTPHLEETSDQQNERYLSGAIHSGCRAIMNCLSAANTTVKDVDFLGVCSCTGYVCPDVGSRLIAHMGFNRNVQRASIIGLGCAGAVPTLQRAADFVRANPSRKALILAVEKAPDSSGNLWVIQQLYTGDYSHQMPYTFYAKEFIGISAPVVTPLSAGVKNHTLGSRP
jgi:predicted naringenin-chalcone synthase